MTDFTHHTPRLLTDEDAAADLAGVARPSLPSVGADHTDARMTWHRRKDGSLIYVIGNVTFGPHAQGDIYINEADLRRMAACWNACMGVDTEMLEANPAPFSALVSERDELASRVRELEGDAKRWRFLLGADSPTVCTYEEDDQSGEWVPIHPQNIQIVVDAEMATAAALNASNEHP